MYLCVCIIYMSREAIIMISNHDIEKKEIMGNKNIILFCCFVKQPEKVGRARHHGIMRFDIDRRMGKY